ncbi:MAG: STAS domain-containing protein, partial [Gemmatimonadaceae bacterium]
MAMPTNSSSSAARFRIPTSASPAQGASLRSSVREALRLGARRLVIDCDAWSEVDVNVLSSLIQCASACREHGASFEVENISPIVLN